MIFKNDEYSIDGDNVIISKYALEDWYNHYNKVAMAYRETDMYLKYYYMRKADSLIDILKHFDEEEI